MNRQKQERARQNIFRTIAFGLMFLLLATSIAGIASILFQNSPLDETGSGENNVELANTLVSNPSSSSTYTLTTKQDLQNWASNSGYWASGKTTVLAADIDWGGSSGGNYPRVTNFTGTFDGQNHVVKNIYMKYAIKGVGFISTSASGAVVRSFGLVGGTIDGGHTSGGTASIVGSSEGTLLIENCFSTANLYGGYGMSGIADGGNESAHKREVFRSFFLGTITHNISGTWESLGIYGGFNGGSNVLVEDCFNAGIFTGNQTINQSSQCGGIIRGTDPGTTANRVYNVGKIQGYEYTGGEIGAISAYQNATVTNAYNASEFNKGSLKRIGGKNFSNVFNNSTLWSSSNGIGVSQANMVHNDTLKSGGSMSGLGTTNWYKRPNAGGDLYYPELVAFAGTDGKGNDSWGRLKNWVADISKWSVTAEQNTSAPAFTVGVAVSYTQPSEAQTTLPEYEGDITTGSLVINQAFLQASVPSGMTILWSDVQLKGTNPSTYIDMSTTSNSITLKSKFSDADRTFTLEFTLTPGNTGGIQALPTVVSLTIKVPKTPNIITII